MLRKMVTWLTTNPIRGRGLQLPCAFLPVVCQRFTVVPFYRVQGEEQHRADFGIRESLGNQLQYF